MLEALWSSRGLGAASLWPLSLLYGGLVGLHRRMFEWGWRPRQRLSVPVIVIGNLVAGGAGKTPAVMAVTALLKRHAWRPGIVSRGYGRGESAARLLDAQMSPQEAGDEPLLLRRRLAVPVAVGASRHGAGELLLREHPQVNVIIADDGLQHRGLHRDIEVIVFDERGIGNGWLLPAGPLREPMPDRAPLDALVIYNADRETTSWPGWMGTRSLQGAVALDAWWHGAQATSFDAVQGIDLLAVAGTARPERFFNALRSAGLRIRAMAMPDHHDYHTLPWPAGTADVIVTEKDAIKLRPEHMGSTRVWVAPLDFDPGAAFDAALLKRLSEVVTRHATPAAATPR